MLQIRPILYINDGMVDVLEKPRTGARAVRRMVENIQGEVGSNPVHAAVVHADIPEDVGRLEEELASGFNCVEFYVTEFTPVMGAHTGSGVLGVAFFSDED